jgi:signal transduction histidine kinase
MTLGEEKNGAVLVVDDEPANRELLRDLLEARGFDVREAADGFTALNALQNEDLPDVILLDVMMPGIDGFEVCRRIRENPVTAHLPVLIVTALADRASRLRGISEGAADFLTKPIDTVDTHLRVRNAAKSKRLYDQLAEKNRRLIEAEQARDSLVHMIVHDLKSPLTSVLGYCKLLKGMAKQRMDEQQTEFLERSIAGGHRTLEMVDSILSVSRLEDGQLVLNRESVNVATLLAEVESSAQFMAMDGMRLEFECPHGLTIACDGSLVRRVLSNLVDNAMRFADRKAGLVKVLAQEGPDHVEFSVADNGKGIPEHARASVFEKFSQVAQTSRRNYGLGLAFCRLAVEHHGGRIWVDGQADQGAVFRFIIPTQDGI